MEHLRPKLDTELKERGGEKITKMEEKTGQQKMSTSMVGLATSCCNDNV